MLAEPLKRELVTIVKWLARWGWARPYLKRLLSGRPSRNSATVVDALKAVGYWSHDGRFSRPSPHEVAFTDGFPHPARLVESLGASPPDDRILRYLRSGYPWVLCLGFSYCRFGCERIEGTRCLTDGTWVWPEGLAHYVEVHGVPLPDEFLKTMEMNRWTVPHQCARARVGRARSDGGHLSYWDRTFWVEWTARTLKQDGNTSGVNDAPTEFTVLSQ